jgi:hypothetical protein
MSQKIKFMHARKAKPARLARVENFIFFDHARKASGYINSDRTRTKNPLTTLHQGELIRFP